MIRPAAAADHPAIAALTEAAFGRADEARLIEALRTAGDVELELVAEEGGEVLGHILFSRLVADRPGLFLALAPMAVRPGRQGEGLGGALIGEGLAACRRAGAAAVIVLGHRRYYPRFGFSAEAAAKVASAYAGSPAFMALELLPGALAAPLAVTYSPAFG